VKKAYYLFEEKEADFSIVTCNEGELEIYIYIIKEKFGDKQEYYYSSNFSSCYCSDTFNLIQDNKSPIVKLSI
jgi:hypothetical protein